MRDAWRATGSTRTEAERITTPMTQGVLPLAVQPQRSTCRRGKSTPSSNGTSGKALGKVRIDPEKGEITVIVPLDRDETEGLKGCVDDDEAKTKVEEGVESTVRVAEIAFGGSGKNCIPLLTSAKSTYRNRCSASARTGCYSSSRARSCWNIRGGSAPRMLRSRRVQPTRTPPWQAGLVDAGTQGEVLDNPPRETPEMISSPPFTNRSWRSAVRATGRSSA